MVILFYDKAFMLTCLPSSWHTRRCVRRWADAWGNPEETLLYPYADSEDRSILLARLVRDVVGIDVVLIYYSKDHLAVAVDFTDAVAVGDFLKLEDRRFIICDPSYIGGHVGETMPTMKDSETTLIQVK